jgi:CRP-like cAMP-binding protein
MLTSLWRLSANRAAQVQRTFATNASGRTLRPVRKLTPNRSASALSVAHPPMIWSHAGQPAAERLASSATFRTWVAGRASAAYEAMLKPRGVSLMGVTAKTNLSNLAGHGSFLMLALGYMESDVLLLRAYAAGGVVLSILFQYYRPQPLWIPISWNTLFLIINGAMITALLAERAEVSHMDPNETRLYEAVFAKLGLDPVEFLRLIRLAERRIVKSGTAIAMAGKPQQDMYLIVDGGADVLHKEGRRVGSVTSHQFVGSMAFQRFLNALHTQEYEETINGGGLKALMVPQAPHALSNSNQVTAEQEEDTDGVEGDTTPTPEARGSNSSYIGDLAKECRSRFTVQTTENCSVYVWDFHLLAAYLMDHPAEANAINTAIAADLTRKLNQSRAPKEAYRQLLDSTLKGGEILPLEKKKLKLYRDKHHISVKQHDSMLKDLGWTGNDFANGIQGSAVSKAFVEYEHELRRELKGGKISNEGKARMREMRLRLGIDSQEHLLALYELGWDLNKYEVGSKDGRQQ